MKKENRLNIHKYVSIVFALILSFILGGFSVIEVTAANVNASDIIRFDGESRAEVAENVAKAHFSGSNKVVIVNQDKFPDAISATNISQGRYPVLYTRAGKIQDSTLDLLRKMSLNEIYILGGQNSINNSVVSKIQKATGVKITRVDGSNRYDANVSAVETNFNHSNHVVLASGEVFPDALYGVSYANTIDAPVILSKTNKLQNSTVQLLKKLNVKAVTIIGGTSTITTNVENQLSNLGISINRIAGKDRYVGSAEVANFSYSNPSNIIIASGEVFSDALVSAPLAQKLNAPILLVRSNKMTEEVDSYLGRNKSPVYILGGPNTISYDLLATKGTKYHIVKPGHTVYSISNYYGLHGKALNHLNKLSGDNIQVNQVLSVDGTNEYSSIVQEKNTFNSTKEFIEHVAPIAVELAGKYELYPSVMIAQSVLETGSGTSELATIANNYFGIKGSYNGNSISKMSPEEINGQFSDVRSNFRIYPNLYSSFEDNGKRLRLGPNTDSNSKPWSSDFYSGTWVENTDTYEDATQALVDAGYATDSNYSNKLNTIIENYNLTQFDDMVYQVK